MLSVAEFEALVNCRHLTMACYWQYDLLRSFASRGPSIAVIDRRSFDNALLEKAASAGADVITGDRVRIVENGVAETASGRRLHYSSLVGADGAVSTVRSHVFGRLRRRQGFGLEVFIPGHVCGQGAVPGIEIHFGLIPYGYGWIFPRKNDFCIGLGSIDGRTAASTIAEKLREFILRYAGGDHAELRGGVIPSLSLYPALGKGRVYLAGDAAGLVDHVSGEGIGYAIESGLLVAEGIASGNRRRMQRKASAGCVSRVRQSIHCRHLLYSPICRPRAMRSLRDKKKFFAGYWKLVSGEISYGEMIRGFLLDR
jgi:flavin-dependent dehydrogenase